MKFNYLLNPFEKIAGAKALIIGLIGMLMASIIGYNTNTHFDGVLSVHSGRQTTYPIHILEPLISWLYVSILFSLTGTIFSKSKIRIIDVFGTQAFAFIPLIPASFVGVISIINTMPEKLSGLTPHEVTQNIFSAAELISLAVVSIFLLIIIAWSAIWMYNAYKLSTNLHNKYLIPFYMITIISGFILPSYLLSLIIV